MDTERQIKAIRLLQERDEKNVNSHRKIAADLAEVKRRLLALDGAVDAVPSKAFEQRKSEALAAMVGRRVELPHTDLSAIYSEAEARFPEPVALADILSQKDFAETERRIGRHVLDFNRRYGLDRWDYAIAGSCGLFAATLDLLLVRAPLKPTAKWTQQVDGVFNKAVQADFNRMIPPEMSARLSRSNTIGAADSSTMASLPGTATTVLNPTNHRMRSLAHDPLLGFIFGVLDMRNGTCTTVVNGAIRSIPSTKGQTGGTIFQLLARMLGHLFSDVNAPTANGNRGMGLPAPFMGLLRMFDSIPVGNSTFDKQVEWMFVKGYDFRQFAATSLPMVIMEVLLRSFYVAKQMKLHGAGFGEAVLDTVPGLMNPRFRIVLALAYGTSSAVNAGKVYVTGNLLNVNYASWMGLAWNSFHALKWELLDRQAKLWGEVEAKEVAELELLVAKMDALEERAANLPL